MDKHLKTQIFHFASSVRVEHRDERYDRTKRLSRDQDVILD